MLNIENDLQQEQEAQHSGDVNDLLGMFMGNASSQYCEIDVKRDNLIEDALNIISRTDLNFKKELRVSFVGEQGEDRGGVRKEFFQLVLKQVFDPAYSMFNYSEETRIYWFNPDSFEPRIKFELVGFIIGLALYNSVILDIHFPRIVYKKLLGQKHTFEVK